MLKGSLELCSNATLWFKRLPEDRARLFAQLLLPGHSEDDDDDDREKVPLMEAVAKEFRAAAAGSTLFSAAPCGVSLKLALVCEACMDA
jgi:hypothetical protein